MCDAREYGCSGHRLGGARSNGVRISREVVQNKLFGKLREDLLSPASIKVIGADMQACYLEQMRARETHTVEAPREQQDLTARIARLRERLRAGDPDMAPNEIQAAIDRAEDKRRELFDQQLAAKQSARVLSMLPRAAETIRREIAAALGDSRASLKARTILRDVYEGKIQLRPQPGGGLTAHWNFQPIALLKSAAVGAVPCGSGGRI
jgi:site-specific DNA recombinase